MPGTLVALLFQEVDLIGYIGDGNWDILFLSKNQNIPFLIFARQTCCRVLNLPSGPLHTSLGEWPRTNSS
jgi:hypothetical protein